MEWRSHTQSASFAHEETVNLDLLNIVRQRLKSPTPCGCREFNEASNRIR